MNIRYKLVNWEFNKGAWGRAMQESIDAVGVDIVAGVMDVSPKTVRNWAVMYETAYSEYPHPNMTNFMKFCNEFDKDPREFFMLEDV